MSNLPRPPLGSRATSDMAPLISTKPDMIKREIARGTHVIQAGARITSGKRTALGGIAPFSPFLPLPPAPTADELRRQCKEKESSMERMIAMENQEEAECEMLSAQWLEAPEMFQRRASSTDLAESPRLSASSTFTKPLQNPAAFMIRSYSMPVATQRDFEAQQRAARLQRQQRSKLSFTPAWSMSRTNSTEGNEEMSSIQREPLRMFESSEMNGTSLARTASRHQAIVGNNNETDLLDHQARNLFKWDCVSNQTPSPVESGSTSCSDEAEVSTPRATSPYNKTSFFEENVKQEDSIQALSELQIHPDHLQPPPFTGF